MKKVVLVPTERFCVYDAAVEPPGVRQLRRKGNIMPRGTRDASSGAARFNPRMRVEPLATGMPRTSRRESERERTLDSCDVQQLRLGVTNLLKSDMHCALAEFHEL